ncbi:hypothetical protein LNP25_28295 [Klebsiella variicola subsp. variicola]|nr:hypothetical protein [Klebsiella variicola subsp. variicola]
MINASLYQSGDWPRKLRHSARPYEISRQNPSRQLVHDFVRNYWQEYQLSKMRSNFLRTAAAVTGDKEKRKVKTENETAIPF